MMTSDMFKRKAERLFAEFKAGKKAAFNEITKLCMPELVKIAMQILPSESDAHEIAQDAMLKAFKTIKYFRSASSISTWLYRITQNAAKTRYRKIQRYKKHYDSIGNTLQKYHSSGDSRAGISYPPSEMAIRQELSNLLISKAHLLSRELYTVLHLRYIMLLSYKEIAAILNCPPGTVKSRLHRARNRIKALLRQELL